MALLQRLREEELWHRANSASTEEVATYALETELIAFPTGVYSDKARAKLAALKAVSLPQIAGNVADYKSKTNNGKIAIDESAMRKIASSSPHFTVPDSILSGKSSEVTFKIEYQGVMIKDFFRSDLYDDVSKASVKPSDSIRATLFGPPDMISIHLRGDANAERQLVTTITPAEWTWDVTGLDSGQVNLHLQVICDVITNNGSDKLVVADIDRLVDIKATYYDSLNRIIERYKSIAKSIWDIITTISPVLLAVASYFGWKVSRSSKGDAK